MLDDKTRVLMNCEERLKGLNALQRFVYIYANVNPRYDSRSGRREANEPWGDTNMSLLSTAPSDASYTSGDIEQILLFTTFLMACRELGYKANQGLAPIEPVTPDCHYGRHESCNAIHTQLTASSYINCGCDCHRPKMIVPDDESSKKKGH